MKFKNLNVTLTFVSHLNKKPLNFFNRAQPEKTGWHQG
jgi:hypothetical protein